MYRTIKIGDKEVPMLAMASADIYYKQIFGEDILKVLTRDETEATAERIGSIQRMGFVMAMFAKYRDRKQMQALNEDSYIDWLDQFSRGDMLAACTEILTLYMGQAMPEAHEKNAEEG